MSKSNGARSHASEAAAQHASRIAAGNASRLAAAGLALFLTFGYGGVAHADADRADVRSQAGGGGPVAVPGAVPGTASGTAQADSGATAPDAAVTEPPGGEPVVVAMTSATSTDSDTEERVVFTATNGVVTKTTTLTPVTDAGGAFAARTSDVTPDPARSSEPAPAASAAVLAKKPDTTDEGVGHVAVYVCHKGALVLATDQNALDGHLGHGDTVVTDVDDASQCQPADIPGTFTPVVTTPDETGSNPTETGGGSVGNDDSGSTPGSGGPTSDTGSILGGGGTAGDDDTTAAEGDGSGGSDPSHLPEGEPTDNDTAPGVDGIDVSNGGTGPAEGSNGPGRPTDVVNPTQDAVERPGQPSVDRPGTAPGEVRGEQSERPRGADKATPTAPTGKVLAGEVATDRAVLLPAQAADEPAVVLGVRGDVAAKNRPAALVLPETGAAENLSMQAGAGLLMVIAGAMTLRGRRRETRP